MKKTMIGGLAALALAGCAAPGLPVPETPVDFVRVKSAKPVKVVGTDVVTFRSFVGADRQSQTEVAGAKCDLTTPGLRSRLVTPAKLRLPRTQGRTGPLTVKCTRETLTHTQVVPQRLPIRSPGAVSTPGAPGAGLVASIIVSAAAAGIASARDIWAFGEAGTTYRATLK